MRIGIASAAALIVGAASSAQAADFSVLGGPPASGGGLGECSSYSRSGNAPVSGSGSCTGSGLGTSSGSSSARYGKVGAEAEAYQFNPSQSIPSIWESRASFQDFITFTSDDPTATFTDIAVFMALDGLIAEIGTGQSLDLLGELRVGSLSNYSFVRLAPNGTNTVSMQNMSVAEGTLSASGLSEATLRSSTYRVALNQPLYFSMTLASRVGAIGGGGGQVDFGSTFGFAFDNAVFDLAPGVTANAGTWLVDNRNVTVAQAVPEPATWAMMLSGFGLIGGMARRRSAMPRALA